MNIFTFGIALVFYFVIHSVLANKQVKVNLTNSLIPLKYYRLFFNIIAISTSILLFFFYKKIDAQFLFEHTEISIFGKLVTALGLVISTYALFQYNLSEFIGTQQLQNRQAISELKMTGLNRIVRHPLYFGTLVLIWGFFLSRPTDLVLVTVSIISIYTYFGTKLEEKKLIEEFGQAYKKYQKKVPMLLPFFK